MSDFFTKEELETLKLAAKKEAQVQELGDEIDQMLNPLCTRILAKTPDELKELLPKIIDKFPRGFQRSELRTIMIQLGIR